MTRAKDISKIVTDADLSGTLDVTGTVTAGGLTVNNGVMTIGGEGISSAYLNAPEQMYFNVDSNNTPEPSGFEFGVGRTGSTGGKRRITIGGDGDISFYEDTGATPKFFWDASEERLGIGTSSPARTLSVERTGGSIIGTFKRTDSSSAFITFGDSTTTTDAYVGIGADGNDLFLRSGNAEKLRIDSSGKVGIGVVPEAGWSGTWDAVQIGLTGSLSSIASGSIGRTFISDNAYNDSNSQSTSWQYQIADQASQIALLDGTVEFRVATTGSADADITWNQAVTLNNSGNVGIGTASPLRAIHVESSDTLVGRFKSTGSTEGFIQLAGSGTSTAPRLGATGNNLVFYTSDTERMRILSTGGITFNGDTATANALDDYEEGTWTATLTGGTTNPTTPVTANYARYTKIGRTVHVMASFEEKNTSGASGSIIITGLPFTSTTNGRHTGAALLYSIGTFTGSICSYIGSNTTNIAVFQSISNSAYQLVNHNAGSSRYLWVSITYDT